MNCRRTRWALCASVLAIGLIASGLVPTSAFANPTSDENLLAGTADWALVNPATNREIEGYASATSVNGGDAIDLFVNTASANYTIDVFRMGWYDGLGGRQVAGPILRAGIVQTIPAPDADGMVNCDWTNATTIVAEHGPGDPWASGVYLARLTTGDSGKQSYILFVVRDDARVSDLVVQIPVTTYQAYNFWGGRSTYGWGSGNALPWGSTSGTPANKVSFNRPYAASTNPAAAYGMGAGEFMNNIQPVAEGYPISSAGWDYNMVRFLEREGYDVTYVTNIDVHQSPTHLTGKEAFLSIGHDEYWSHAMRANVEAARDTGLDLAFFTANAVYWQVRFEPDPNSANPDRVMVIYKSLAEDPFANDGDPANDIYTTVRWRDAILGRSEDGLVGVRYYSDPFDGDMIIADASHPYFAGTGLQNGDALVGLLGYEVDERSGGEPAGTVTLAASPASGRTAHMTMYTAASGAQVFATGSMQWSWGLDDFGAPALRSSRLNGAAQQVTRNVLNGFGALPADLPPTSEPDTYSVLTDSVLNVAAPGVLANDFDAQPLSAFVVGGPFRGALTPNLDGGFDYTPDPGFSGTDVFFYRADDGAQLGVATRVKIDVVAGARCVRLRALSEVNGNPWTSASEIRGVGGNGVPLPPGAFSVAAVDSEELVDENGAAANAIDDDTSTIWHTEYGTSTPVHPHTIDLDLGTPHALQAIRYLPRQAGSINGTIADYEVALSADCGSYSTVASGTWGSDRGEKEARIPVPEPNVLAGLMAGALAFSVSQRSRRRD